MKTTNNTQIHCLGGIKSFITLSRRCMQVKEIKVGVGNKSLSPWRLESNACITWIRSLLWLSIRELQRSKFWVSGCAILTRPRMSLASSVKQIVHIFTGSSLIALPFFYFTGKVSGLVKDVTNKKPFVFICIKFFFVGNSGKASGKENGNRCNRSQTRGLSLRAKLISIVSVRSVTAPGHRILWHFSVSRVPWKVMLSWLEYYTQCDN
jgi:hypothetical protein